MKPGDVLVLNDSRVFPARLRGSKDKTGGKVEILLLEENQKNDWQALLRPSKRVHRRSKIHLSLPDGTPSGIEALLLTKNIEGHCRLQFSGSVNILERLNLIGEVPLPPYIRRPADPATDRERYQTVYAGPTGSVAAPTAGLHFTEALLEELRRKGVIVCFVTLHVGLGTFAPVKADKLADHSLHEERFELSSATARAINEARNKGHRIFAVGTTTVRVLESVAAENDGQVVESAGRTRIFIYPPFDFKVVNAIVTNFHLPKSTLLMLVSAFTAPKEIHGRALVLSAYAEAVGEHYRFFSYGDAMLIL
jgi:S-adenosylmethionine:tRNA ribosyltransferase-isomerase